MNWKFEPGVPLSAQIVDRLRADIVSGKYERGTPFPTVRQLANDISVNPNTVQKALSVLEDEGLLVTLGTQGRVVADNEAAISEAKVRLTKSSVAKIIRAAKELSLEKRELIDYIEKGWDE